MKKLIALLLFAVALRAQNTNNDSSCDISVTPAATLLLPYFEVETAQRGITTLFTVTNVSAQPHVAHVTLWTDYGFPAATFNLHLTPYDAQPINLYDVIVDGVVAADEGTVGGNCGGLPRKIPEPLRADLVSALTMGKTAACTGTVSAPRIGNNHGTLAVGYATIDVVQACSSTIPTSDSYFRDEILFDNVLIGDYEAFDPQRKVVAASPLVHIREVPEGGAAGTAAVPATLPITFYGRYLGNAPGLDRRQPLPATFAAHVYPDPWWRDGSNGRVRTRLKIWREGAQGALPSCLGYVGTRGDGFDVTPSQTGNAFLPFTEIVRSDDFDAAWLGNGCTPPVPDTGGGRKGVIGPAGSASRRNP